MQSTLRLGASLGVVCGSTGSPTGSTGSSTKPSMVFNPTGDCSSFLFHRSTPVIKRNEANRIHDGHSMPGKIYRTAKAAKINPANPQAQHGFWHFLPPKRHTPSLGELQTAPKLLARREDGKRAAILHISWGHTKSQMPHILLLYVFRGGHNEHA